LLFVAVLLVGEAITAGLVVSVRGHAAALGPAAPAWWASGRNIANYLLESAMQMAGVFTTATSTLILRPGAAPRWLG